MSRRFTRTVEDFTCAHCGALVKGDGYTDHCPRCLWSLHSDVNPGDRASPCRGLMEPVAVEQRRGRHVIVYRCQGCGQVKRVRRAVDDNLEVLLQVAENAAGRATPRRRRQPGPSSENGAANQPAQRPPPKGRR